MLLLESVALEGAFEHDWNASTARAVRSARATFK